MKNTGNFYDKDDYLSLWLCNVSSEETLQEYVRIDYVKAENDEISFVLGCDFNISWYDEDFFETSYRVNKNGLRLLEGHSYIENIIPELIENFQGVAENQFNGVIIIYNFRYDGIITEIENSQYGCFRFVGSFKYR